MAMLKDIKPGQIYRHIKPDGCYAEVIEVLKPNQGVNPHSYAIVKVKWSRDLTFDFSIAKYFRPRDLILYNPTD